LVSLSNQQTQGGLFYFGGTSDDHYIFGANIWRQTSGGDGKEAGGLYPGHLQQVREIRLWKSGERIFFGSSDQIKESGLGKRLVLPR